MSFDRPESLTISGVEIWSSAQWWWFVVIGLSFARMWSGKIVVWNMGHDTVGDARENDPFSMYKKIASLNITCQKIVTFPDDNLRHL